MSRNFHRGFDDDDDVRDGQTFLLGVDNDLQPNRGVEECTSISEVGDRK
jgi:hypothetical protein